MAITSVENPDLFHPEHLEAEIEQAQEWMWQQASDPSYTYGDGKWKFDFKVTDWRPDERPRETTKRGITIFRDVVTLENSDGLELDYQAHYFLPRNLKSNVAVRLGAPWLTSDRGHNPHTALSIAELDLAVLFIGIEGNSRRSLAAEMGRFLLDPKKTFEELSAIELALSAHNGHQILDANGGPKGGRHFYDQQQIINVGESRDAMINMGTIAFSEAHHRKSIYTESLAPCFKDKLEFKDLEKYKKQPIDELKALGRLIVGSPFSRLRHYPGTINLSPKALAFQAATFRTLKSGQAGEMAEFIPHDTNMHVTPFTGDVAGQGDQWLEFFSGNPGVVVDPVDGSHLSLAKYEIFAQRLARLRNLRDELIRVDDDASDIDFEKVHLNPAAYTA